MTNRTLLFILALLSLRIIAAPEALFAELVDRTDAGGTATSNYNGDWNTTVQMGRGK